MLEIERKFLVESDEFKKLATSKDNMIQGFLNTDPERTIRIRIMGDSAFFTVKGRTSPNGLSRFEWEYQIPLADGRALLELCEQRPMEKIRYRVPVHGHVFEVDEFFGVNEGLLLAEVELRHEEEAVVLPDWLGKEVTGQTKYYNSQLALKPYTTWND